MNIKLLLACAISLLSIACTDQLTPVEPVNSGETVLTMSDGSVQMIPPDTNRRELPKNPRPSIFKDLLLKLNLSSEQKAKVDSLLIIHRKCTEECTKILKQAEREILLNAKIQEDEIKNKLKAGELSREEAMKQLRQLKEQVNKNLKLLVVRTKVKECIISCDNTFITQLKLILTQEQVVLVEKWQLEKVKRG